MAAPVDIRLLQLRRMLGGAEIEDAPGAAAAIAANPAAFVTAIFHEAADSDDVTSPESARDYLESRLAFFGDLITLDTAAAIRGDFADRLRAWE